MRDLEVRLGFFKALEALQHRGARGEETREEVLVDVGWPERERIVLRAQCRVFDEGPPRAFAWATARAKTTSQSSASS